MGFHTSKDIKCIMYNIYVYNYIPKSIHIRYFNNLDYCKIIFLTVIQIVKYYNTIFSIETALVL